MKKIILIPLALILSFCNCKKSVIQNSDKFVIESICPNDGKCTIQIEKNKSLVLKTDNLGKTYYQLTDNTDTSVIHFQYDRFVEEGLQDGQHREEIIFEINNSMSKMNLENDELQKTKMLFGRHCYCKGKAGYFKVEEGILNVEKINTSITVDLDFKIHQVPQLFTKVKATIK